MKNNFKSIAKNVIDLEINALKKLKKSISKDFDKAISAIVKCKGKVILSGVGKSGIIAKKISSTLASVGTPSFFIDANSSSHGDLGMISSRDLLILISLSGESSELKNLIQYASRNINITLIGITSKKNSILARSCDIKLILPIVKEAGPGNYVPTSSTIIQLSIGDAIAISTMRYKNFSSLQFKKFHPSGSLGAKLRVVSDLMYVGKHIPFINQNIKMSSALKILSKKNLGLLIVRDNKNRTVGILTDGDIKRASSVYDNFKDLTVNKLMTKKPVSVKANILAAEALSIMNNKKITALCVYDKSKSSTIGLIHMHKILDANIQ